MPTYRSDDFAEFARQLTFAPPNRRRAQIERAEALYWDLDADHHYPLDFVVYRITRYRPDTFQLIAIVGKVLRHDLLLLVDELSATLDDTVDRHNPPPLSLDELCQKLNVTTKTIQRYRTQGLFARRLIYSDGRRRLAFLPASVDRFLAHRDTEAEQRARTFTRIDDDTAHAIITRARRLVARRPQLTPFQAARHLAPRFDRSVEAVRQLLVRHDRRDGRVAIFPRHVPPLSERQQRVIHRAYHRGVSVGKLARRFGKSRNAIYRAIHRRRAAAIAQLNLSYVASPTFELPDAEQVILESHLPQPTPPKPNGRKKSRAPDTQADATDLAQLYSEQPHDAPLERALFVRYNFLKYQAAQLRDQLNPSEPRSRELDRIETRLRRAAAIKSRIFRANLPLVISMARKHLATRSQRHGPTLSQLIAEGNRVLLARIETYDVRRQNRFAAYLSYALMRRFAQYDPQTAAGPAAERDTLHRVAAEYWPAALNPVRAAIADAADAADTFAALLDELDETERLIVTRHFGISEDGQHVEPQPLATIAAQLDVPLERARRIERRSITKIRRAAAAGDLALTPPDKAGDGDTSPDSALSSPPEGATE